MLLLEEISYDVRLPLPAAQVTANASHQFGAVAGATFSEPIGLDVLVEQFIRIELRAAGSGTSALRWRGRTLWQRPSDAPGDHRRSDTACPSPA